VGGGFAIAESVRVSGTAQWLADHLGNWAKTLHIIPFLMCLCLTVTFLTEIASNTATATILMPVLIPAAIAADLHPLVLLVPACIACSTAFMLPSKIVPFFGLAQ
jgi:sodium-dependent dicarboxylate transporter 2/3/5